MGPIVPDGHRRRRSSLISPAVSATRTRGHSARQQPCQSGLHPHHHHRHRQPSPSAEPKIREEQDELESLRRPLSCGCDSGSDVLSDEDVRDDEELGLNKRDKQRRRQKRSQNSRLDQLITRDTITREEKAEADHSVVRRLLVNVGLVGLWYLFSLSISLYNKWMFSGDKLNFAFPLFTSSVHMLVQFTLASLTLYFMPSLHAKRAHRSDLGQSRHESEPEAPVMTKWFYLTRIGPCGAATSLDIGLGNTSLKFITLTFYTMCKSSALAFVLLFAFLFRLERPTWRLVSVIMTMTVGVIMMVAGEVHFHAGGFALVISAAFFSGFRWAVTQILLIHHPATSNPISSIFFISPIMFVTLLLIAIPSEGIPELVQGLRHLTEQRGAPETALLILFPGTLAFCMTASEFALLQRTSVVTLSIAGIFKEVLTISIAAGVFGDKLTLINFAGLIITLLTIVFYNYIKITKMREEACLKVHRNHLEDHENTSSGAESHCGSGSDLDGDDGAEETGLLHAGGKAGENDEMLHTVDGDFIAMPHDDFRPGNSGSPTTASSPVPGSSSHASGEGHFRSQRED